MKGRDSNEPPESLAALERLLEQARGLVNEIDELYKKTKAKEAVTYPTIKEKIEDFSKQLKEKNLDAEQIPNAGLEDEIAKATTELADIKEKIEKEMQAKKDQPPGIENVQAVAQANTDAAAATVTPATPASPNVTTIEIPFVPPKVEMAHLNQDLRLVDKEIAAEIIKKLKEKPDARYVKRGNELKPIYDSATNKRPGAETGFSIIKHEGQYYALYQGQKTDKQAGVGGYGVVKYVQNITTGEWAILKQFSNWHIDIKRPKEDIKITPENKLGEIANNEHKRANLMQLAIGSKPQDLRTAKVPKGQQTSVLMKLAEGVELLQHNITKKHEMINIILSVCEEFNKLHHSKENEGKNILHCDIKPENIIYDPSTGKVSIIDPGEVLEITSGATITISNPVGTDGFIAPESLEKNEYSTKSDCYSIGVTIADIVHQNNLGLKLCINEPGEKIEINSRDDFLNLVPNDDKEYYSAIYDLCSDLMKSEPDERLTLPQAIARLNTLRNKYDTDEIKVLIIDFNKFLNMEVQDMEFIIETLSNFADEVVLTVTSNTIMGKNQYITLINELQSHGVRVYNNVFQGDDKDALRKRIVETINVDGETREYLGHDDIIDKLLKIKNKTHTHENDAVKKEKADFPLERDLDNENLVRTLEEADKKIENIENRFDEIAQQPSIESTDNENKDNVDDVDDLLDDLEQFVEGSVTYEEAMENLFNAIKQSPYIDEFKKLFFPDRSDINEVTSLDELKKLNSVGFEHNYNEFISKINGNPDFWEWSGTFKDLFTSLQKSTKKLSPIQPAVTHVIQSRTPEMINIKRTDKTAIIVGPEEKEPTLTEKLRDAASVFDRRARDLESLKGIKEQDPVNNITDDRISQINTMINDCKFISNALISTQLSDNEKVRLLEQHMPLLWNDSDRVGLSISKHLKETGNALKELNTKRFRSTAKNALDYNSNVSAENRKKILVYFDEGISVGTITALTRHDAINKSKVILTNMYRDIRKITNENKNQVVENESPAFKMYSDINTLLSKLQNEYSNCKKKEAKGIISALIDTVKEYRTELISTNSNDAKLKQQKIEINILTNLYLKNINANDKQKIKFISTVNNRIPGTIEEPTIQKSRIFRRKRILIKQTPVAASSPPMQPVGSASNTTTAVPAVSVNPTPATPIDTSAPAYQPTSATTRSTATVDTIPEAKPAATNKNEVNKILGSKKESSITDVTKRIKKLPEKMKQHGFKGSLAAVAKREQSAGSEDEIISISTKLKNNHHFISGLNSCLKIMRNRTKTDTDIPKEPLSEKEISNLIEWTTIYSNELDKITRHAENIMYRQENSRLKNTSNEALKFGEFDNIDVANRLYKLTEKHTTENNLSDLDIILRDYSPSPKSTEKSEPTTPAVTEASSEDNIKQKKSSKKNRLSPQEREKLFEQFSTNENESTTVNRGGTIGFLVYETYRNSLAPLSRVLDQSTKLLADLTAKREQMNKLLEQQSNEQLSNEIKSKITAIDRQLNELNARITSIKNKQQKDFETINSDSPTIHEDSTAEIKKLIEETENINADIDNNIKSAATTIESLQLKANEAAVAEPAAATNESDEMINLANFFNALLLSTSTDEEKKTRQTDLENYASTFKDIELNEKLNKIIYNYMSNNKFFPENEMSNDWVSGPKKYQELLIKLYSQTLLSSKSPQSDRISRYLHKSIQEIFYDHRINQEKQTRLKQKEAERQRNAETEAASDKKTKDKEKEPPVIASRDDRIEQLRKVIEEVKAVHDNTESFLNKKSYPNDADAIKEIKEKAYELWSKTGIALGNIINKNKFLEFHGAILREDSTYVDEKLSELNKFISESAIKLNLIYLKPTTTSTEAPLISITTEDQQAAIPTASPAQATTDTVTPKIVSPLPKLDPTILALANKLYNMDTGVDTEIAVELYDKLLFAGINKDTKNTTELDIVAEGLYTYLSSMFDDIDLTNNKTYNLCDTLINQWDAGTDQQTLIKCATIQREMLHQLEAQKKTQLKQLKETETQSITALSKLGITAPTEHTPKQRTNLDEDLQADIARLRSTGYINGTRQDGKRVLIKINSGINDSPIHPEENRIQALRYMRGMLLIINNSNVENKNDIINQMQDLYDNTFDPAKTHAFIESLSKLLAEHFSITLDDARSELSKAKNMSELLEEHPDIVTCSRNPSQPNQITIETASLLKVSSDFYDQHFNDLKNQPWFEKAEKKSAIKGWKEKAFQSNRTELKRLGVPAASSARWLPLPANAQKIETYVISATEPNKIISSSQWTRLATIGLSNLREKDKQSKLAESQVREVIDQIKKEGKENFTNLYAPLIPIDVKLPFVVSYQTLMTPHFGEKRIGSFHTDNNTKFINTTLDVIQSLNKPTSFTKYLHTNSAINAKSGWFTAKNKESDSRTQLAFKLDCTSNIFKDLCDYQSQGGRQVYDQAQRLEPGQFAAKFREILLEKQKTKSSISNELINEIERRAYAFRYIQKLLDNEDPYKDLSTYQRNLMMAALEYHMMGSQAVTIAGCKSARDRTAIFAAAVKTMQENMSAMNNWETLNRGIIASLEQGHHFRAMSHHCAIAKINKVHTSYFEGLSADTQKGIIDNSQFTGKHKGKSGILGSAMTYVTKRAKWLPGRDRKRTATTAATAPTPAAAPTTPTTPTPTTPPTTATPAATPTTAATFNAEQKPPLPRYNIRDPENTTNYVDRKLDSFLKYAEHYRKKAELLSKSESGAKQLIDVKQTCEKMLAMIKTYEANNITDPTKKQRAEKINALLNRALSFEHQANKRAYFSDESAVLDHRDPVRIKNFVNRLLPINTVTPNKPVGGLRAAQDLFKHTLTHNPINLDTQVRVNFSTFKIPGSATTDPDKEIKIATVQKKDDNDAIVSELYYEKDIVEASFKDTNYEALADQMFRDFLALYKPGKPDPIEIYGDLPPDLVKELVILCHKAKITPNISKITHTEKLTDEQVEDLRLQVKPDLDKASKEKKAFKKEVNDEVAPTTNKPSRSGS